MQFGRFHGIAVLALGMLLLLVQVVVLFKEKAPPTRATAPSDQPAAAEPTRAPARAVEYLSGVIGILLVGGGGYILSQASRKSAAQQLVEERSEEDRSGGREGHHVSTPTIWKER